MLPVEFDVTGMVHAGENTVCVQVYQFSDATYLEDQDMWFLSGIYRDVTLYARPKDHISDIYAKAIFRDNCESADLHIRVEALCGGKAQIKAELLWDRNILCAETKAADSVTTFVFPCSDLHLWSAETPNLYQIRVTLSADGKQLQRKTMDFGFRKITINREKAQLLINGRPLKLRGINYHAFTPDQGYYVSPEVYERDLKLMKRFNINAKMCIRDRYTATRKRCFPHCRFPWNRSRQGPAYRHRPRQPDPCSKVSSLSYAFPLFVLMGVL